MVELFGTAVVTLAKDRKERLETLASKPLQTHNLFCLFSKTPSDTQSVSPVL